MFVCFFFFFLFYWCYHWTSVSVLRVTNVRRLTMYLYWVSRYSPVAVDSTPVLVARVVLAVQWSWHIPQHQNTVDMPRYRTTWLQQEDCQTPDSYRWRHHPQWRRLGSWTARGSSGCSEKRSRKKRRNDSRSSCQSAWVQGLSGDCRLCGEFVIFCQRCRTRDSFPRHFASLNWSSQRDSTHSISHSNMLGTFCLLITHTHTSHTHTHTHSHTHTLTHTHTHTRHTHTRTAHHTHTHTHTSTHTHTHITHTHTHTHTYTYTHAHTHTHTQIHTHTRARAHKHTNHHHPNTTQTPAPAPAPPPPPPPPPPPTYPRTWIVRQLRIVRRKGTIGH